jgi:hypothetical protein
MADEQFERTDILEAEARGEARGRAAVLAEASAHLRKVRDKIADAGRSHQYAKSVPGLTYAANELDILARAHAAGVAAPEER